MREEQLNPVAGMMIDSWLATGEFRLTFADDYGLPPTVAARAHVMRSVMQAKLKDHDRYSLHPSYAELGRVQFTDRDLDQDFLLRSQSAFTIEHGKTHPQLFDSIEYLKSDVLMLVYDFTSADLSLSITGTRHAANRTRLEPTAEPTFVGRWSFIAPTDTPPPFDQSERDLFDELDQDGESEVDAA
jgi:hypothetical protein